ncbi:MAG: SDR family NAD(P)-dependent oxidoreductase [Granulosicoccus sp.]
MQIPNYQACTKDQSAFKLSRDSLQDKVVLVTGATGGLGTSLCKACAESGATLVLASRKEKKLEKLYDVLVDNGAPTPAILPLEQDKAGPAEYIEIAEMLEAEFGKLDAIVHTCAELGTPTYQMAIEHSEWTRVMNVNLNSARLLSLYSQPLLMKSTLGSMVFLLDNKPTAYWGTYGVSKIALQSFMHMLADESENQRGANGHPVLAINGYDPGPMRTQMRRRAFPGELEHESPWPEERLPPLLSLITRADRSITGVAYKA